MSQHYEQSSALAGLDGIRHGFFGRLGGGSLGTFSQNNMSLSVGDDPNIVERNRSEAAAMLGFDRDRLCLVKQVHGTVVHTVEARPGNDTPASADALVTGTQGLALGILTADCTPILLADPFAGVIGAAHAGWRGAVDGIVGTTVEAMVALGAEASRIVAAIGPTITAGNYEVGPQFMGDFLQLRSNGERFFSQGQNERAHFDLPGFVSAELERAGIQSIERVGGCTYASPDRYFSHRYATHQGGTTGRQIAIIGLGQATA